ncbi:MAG: hypothetical protein LBT40_15740 [Deltaproteobacteria bacterium]|nr:hypothetical protein [Deltaproteobacteria bacterium]
MRFSDSARFFRLNEALFFRLDELRRKWVPRLGKGHPESTEGLEAWVEELRWVFYQGEWMVAGLKLAVADQEGTARWLDSLEGPVTPELFYQRFSEARPKMMRPPAERREILRQRHLAIQAGQDPLQDIQLWMREKYGHRSCGNAGLAGPGSGNGGAAAEGVREAGASIGCLQVCESQEAGGGHSSVPVTGIKELPSGHVANWTGAERAVTVMASGSQSGPSFGPSGAHVSGSETVGAVPMAPGSQSGPSFGPSGTNGSGA